MTRQLFLSFFHPRQQGSRIKHSINLHHGVPWIESPLEKASEFPCLYRRSDATPIELFFDLFFVANLSTFTASNDINSLEALWSYVSFLGIIWFTWLQVTLFDIRFARDSIFERICKAVQLATMVGFASAGSGFATQVREENVWIFHALSILLAVSRLILSLEYFLTSLLLHGTMPKAARSLSMISACLLSASATYAGLYFVFGARTAKMGSYVWTVWWFLFAAETICVMFLSSQTPGIGFKDTYLNIRMGLLTLIIIGEGVISIARIVNRTVGGGGWTKWSFVHILGVTTAVYLLWLSYFDITPRAKLGKIRQQIWTGLHFPFHVLLILLMEGSQILALTLDVSLKLSHLRDTILFACETPQPPAEFAINLLNSTIRDMEINYNRGALVEKNSIQDILWMLRKSPFLCPVGMTDGALDMQTSHHLMGNVTVALFSSMGINPPEGDIVPHRSDQLLMMYLKLLGFVFLYYFTVASLAMFMFAVFFYVGHYDEVENSYRTRATIMRVILGCSLLSIIAVTTNFDKAYKFMTSPMILFTVTLALLLALLGDRLWDRLAPKSFELEIPTENESRMVQPSFSLTELSPVPTVQ
ncbi:hypothetical protein FQN57_005441 [Myotisia sp. PD_48]|nr:hypothetical protein FQN57_005441 [Myotisia sp. PD_48]